MLSVEEILEAYRFQREYGIGNEETFSPRDVWADDMSMSQPTNHPLQRIRAVTGCQPLVSVRLSVVENPNGALDVIRENTLPNQTQAGEEDG